MFFVAEIHFWHFWPYTRDEAGVAKWDPAHVTHRVKFYNHTNFKSVAPRVFLAKIPFLHFFITMVTILHNF